MSNQKRIIILTLTNSVQIMSAKQKIAVRQVNILIDEQLLQPANTALDSVMIQSKCQ